MLDNAIAAAQATPYGSATFQAAAALCRLRGLDPHSPALMSTTTHGQPVAVLLSEPRWENWRWVIAEEVLRAHLRQTMALP